MNAYYIEDAIYPNLVFLKGRFDGLAVFVPRGTAEALLAALDAKESRKDEATKTAVEAARVQGFEQGRESLSRENESLHRSLSDAHKQIEAMASPKRERTDKSVRSVTQVSTSVPGGGVRVDFSNGQAFTFDSDITPVLEPLLLDLMRERDEARQ